MSEPITLEVNLRVPNVTIDTPQAPVRRITNADSRFWKQINVTVLPKVGEDLELSTRNFVFPATVKRLEWDDGRNCFVVACQFGRRSITPDEYEDLRADPDWTMKSLV